MPQRLTRVSGKVDSAEVDSVLQAEAACELVEDAAGAVEDMGGNVGMGV